MSSYRRLVLAAGALLGTPCLWAQVPDRPRLQVGALSEPLRVDGLLDELAWAAAPAIEGLAMVEPRQGDAATARTIIKVVAGPTMIAFGVRCQDPDASRIVSFTKERDGDFEAEDHVVIVLDPFQDGRSGYVFAVNPGGARFDALVQPGGEGVDKNWDGEWEAATVRDPGGWTAEIRIPISTLSFKHGLSEWGFNVQRRIQRLQETDRWASPRQDFDVSQPSRAGLLAGLPTFDLGWGLGVRPALVGGFDNPRPGGPTDGTLEPSLDVTKRLGTNALASLTANTDFAETEVDTRQTNLTRFPLFFPEKRTFFLDASDIFAFGSGIGGESLLPFFSRRIGLVEGRQVPILAGLKATGRIGQTNFGGLVVRTREEDALAPASTMAVVRVKQNVLSESRAGFIATAGDPLGRSGSWELGGDFTYQTSHFHGDKNFIAGIWALATGRDDIKGFRESTAFGFKVDYPNDLWDCAALYRRIGDGFDPSLGFVPRRAINSYDAGCTYAPRPDAQLRPSDVSRVLSDAHDGPRRALGELPGLHCPDQLAAGERRPFRVQREPDRRTPGGAFRDRAGRRRFRPGPTTGDSTVSSSRPRPRGSCPGRPRGGLAASTPGRLHQLQLEAAWTPSPLVTFLVNAEHDIGRLEQGDFDLTLVGTRIRLNVSPNLQLNSFLQYDSEDRSFGTNTRLRWTFHPRGDLFVIYNHNLREIQDRWRRDSNQLLVKLQYTFRR